MIIGVLERRAYMWKQNIEFLIVRFIQDWLLERCGWVRD
jgi:hypothetical protein